MIVKIINSGIIYYPENELEVNFCEETDCKFLTNIGYIPKVLFKYWSSYDNELNIYHHKFKYLKENKLAYDGKSNSIITAKSKKDGYYSFNILSNEFQRLSNTDDILNELNLPLHVEIIKTNIRNKEMLELQGNYNYSLLEEIKLLHERIFNLETIIKSTPAVQGSPLNPGIVIITNEKLNKVIEEGGNVDSYTEETIEFLNNINDIIKSK
jgi:hypothetical protein